MRRISRSLAINVCVEFEIDSASVVAAIQPVKQSDGTIDEQALTEYDAFITQAEMYLEDAGLEIIDFDDSDASETSRYYTLADAEAHRNGTSKYVIFCVFRIMCPNFEMGSIKGSNVAGELQLLV